MVTSYRVLQQISRKNATIARLGGDEFSILSPKTTSEHVPVILERIRESESKSFIELEDEKTGEMQSHEVHMSIGYASSSSISATEVLAEADKLMYADKKEWYRTHKRMR